ncbi:MAG: ribose-5-phosphate isomerase RpiA [Deltaproteobacteria bacterium]|nr:MAG: ribose-5-phosphate isomerase RpiA [Deltaproteobacteria bacterium]
MNLVDELKKKAAHRAVEFVTSEMVIGLGTGSTVKFAVERLGELLNSGQLKDIVGIPSSNQTEKLAQGLAIPLTSLDEHPVVDLNIDGADEVDPDLNLIKGGGGALLREKIIAQVSRRNIFIVDQSKLSSQLGSLFSLPVEVIPPARRTEENYLKSLGAAVTLRSDNDGTLFRTDQNNLILDADFGPISDPIELARLLNQRAGIVEHGLFIELADDVIVAEADNIRHLKREK